MCIYADLLADAEERRWKRPVPDTVRYVAVLSDAEGKIRQYPMGGETREDAAAKLFREFPKGRSALTSPAGFEFGTHGEPVYYFSGLDLQWIDRPTQARQITTLVRAEDRP